jgi:hypothetical protein
MRESRLEGQTSQENAALTEEVRRFEENNQIELSFAI